MAQILLEQFHGKSTKAGPAAVISRRGYESGRAEEPMRAELIHTDDARWRSLLHTLRHDIYQTPEYVRVAAAHDGGVPAAYYASRNGSEMLMPLIIRTIPSPGYPDAGSRRVPSVREFPRAGGQTGAFGKELCDVISPYGYGSVLTSGCAAFTSDAVRTFVDVARRHGFVSAFVRLHPLLGTSAEHLVPHGEVVCRGETVYVDLTKSSAEIAAGFRKGHRHNLQRLLENGFLGAMDLWEWYPDFIELYGAEMRRLRADETYHFQADYFETLRTELGPSLRLGVVLSPDSRLAAAGLFTVCGDIVQYHLSASAPEYRSLAPTKLLIAQACSWAKDRGYRFLHLGGGRGGTADSLFRFKAGFSSLRREYHTCDLVIDHDRYESLCRPARGDSVAGGTARGFFPEYRAETRPEALSAF